MNQYDIKITGKDLKRFLKNLHKLKIQFYNITFDQKSMTIRVNEEDYKKIMEIQTIYEIEVVKIYGPIRILKFIQKYRIFFLFLGVGLAVISILSHLIFDVTVVHNKKEIRDLLYEELKEKGISKYHFYLSFDKQEKIVEEIVTKYRNTIEWMEIERIGVSYIIKVEERKETNTETSFEPRDLVAKKDGYVTNIEASSGTILITPNTYVKKGDILVSGSIKNKDTLMAKVRATGKVFAEVWYQTTVTLPYHYQEEIKTGNHRKTLTIEFLNYSWNLFDFNPYQEKETKTLKQIKNSLLPISIKLNEEIETIKKEYLYTKDMVVVEASRMAREKLTKKLGQEDKILYEKCLKITEEDSKIVVVIFFKVKEDITSYQAIPEEGIVEGN